MRRLDSHTFSVVLLICCAHLSQGANIRKSLASEFCTSVTTHTTHLNKRTLNDFGTAEKLGHAGKDEVASICKPKLPAESAPIGLNEKDTLKASSVTPNPPTFLDSTSKDKGQQSLWRRLMNAISRAFKWITTPFRALHKHLTLRFTKGKGSQAKVNDGDTEIAKMSYKPCESLLG